MRGLNKNDWNTTIQYSEDTKLLGVLDKRSQQKWLKYNVIKIQPLSSQNTTKIQDSRGLKSTISSSFESTSSGRVKRLKQQSAQQHQGVWPAPYIVGEEDLSGWVLKGESITIWLDGQSEQKQHAESLVLANNRFCTLTSWVSMTSHIVQKPLIIICIHPEVPQVSVLTLVPKRWLLSTASLHTQTVLENAGLLRAGFLSPGQIQKERSTWPVIRQAHQLLVSVSESAYWSLSPTE